MAKISPEVQQAIIDAAREFNVPAESLFAVAMQESRFQPDAKNSRSTATGLFQHLDGTWGRVTEAYGGRFGITKESSRKDPRNSALMGAALMAENARQLASAGLPVNTANLYMAHFAGIKGAVKAITAPAAKPASAVFGSKVAKANPFMANKTIAEVREFFETKMNKYAEEFAPATPANMNKTGIGWAGSIAPALERIEPEQSAYTPRDQFGMLAAIPTARPDPYASRMANQYGQYRQATMPEMAFAPGGIFDYTRAAADMMPGFDPQEAGQNLQASLSMDMSGTAPGVPSGQLSAADLAGQYSQYQPSSGSAWQNQPTVNERMASPRTPTVEQQRVADAVRQSIAPQVASAPGGLFQPTGAFNNINQTQPTGSFNPSSPFGNGLAAASPAKSGVEQFYDPQQVQRMNEIDKWEQARTQAYPETPRSYPSATPAKPSAPVSPATPAVSTAYQNYAASRMAAPATAVPASRAAGIDVVNSAMSLADQYASYGAGKVAPAPMQTASSATQAAPPMEAPRTVAPREVRQYTPPAPTQPAQPAMTPERARALGMVPTVPGKYMPDVKANPAQVMRDQLGLIAANPFEALARMAMGTLQGGVFHAGNTLGNIASAPGGLFGGSTASGGGAGGYNGGGWSGGSYSGTGYSGRDANPAPGGGFGGFQSSFGSTFDR